MFVDGSYDVPITKRLSEIFDNKDITTVAFFKDNAIESQEYFTSEDVVFSYESWNLFVENVTKKYSITPEDVISILTSISRTGFCNEITGAYFDYTGGVFYITNSCKRFIEMISNKM